jgi:hypothetical protein
LLRPPSLKHQTRNYLALLKADDWLYASTQIEHNLRSTPDLAERYDDDAGVFACVM